MQVYEFLEKTCKLLNSDSLHPLAVLSCIFFINESFFKDRLTLVCAEMSIQDKYGISFSTMQVQYCSII